MKLQSVLLISYIILLAECVANRPSPWKLNLERRGDNPKNTIQWPNSRDSASNRKAQPARQPSSKKSTSPSPSSSKHSSNKSGSPSPSKPPPSANSPSTSRKRGSESSSTSSRAVKPRPGTSSSSTARSRSLSNPSSFSRGSWDRTGFTSSSATSSSGSERYRSPVDEVTGKAIVNGPGVIKIQTGGRGHPAYKSVQKGRAAEESVSDRNKVRVAVRARRGGNGYVSATHALDLGDSHKVTVDARKSKHGGWIAFEDSKGEYDREPVAPGTKDTRYSGHKVSAMIYGPGRASIRTKNGGFVDTDASSSS